MADLTKEIWNQYYEVLKTLKVFIAKDQRYIGVIEADELANELILEAVEKQELINISNLSKIVVDRYNSEYGWQKRFFDRENGELSKNRFQGTSTRVETWEERQLRSKLEKIVYGDPLSCPYCKCTNLYENSVRTYRCSNCRKRFSLMNLSVFKNQKLRLSIINEGLIELINNPLISSVSFARKINVTQKTAHTFMSHVCALIIAKLNTNPGISIDEMIEYIWKQPYRESRLCEYLGWLNNDSDIQVFRILRKHQSGIAYLRDNKIQQWEMFSKYKNKHKFPNKNKETKPIYEKLRKNGYKLNILHGTDKFILRKDNTFISLI